MKLERKILLDSDIETTYLLLGSFLFFKELVKLSGLPKGTLMFSKNVLAWWDSKKNVN
jgi:hypothetical protein